MNTFQVVDKFILIQSFQNTIRNKATSKNVMGLLKCHVGVVIFILLYNAINLKKEAKVLKEALGVFKTKS